ncbi:syndecan-2-like isoform X2 [Sinocyclocheilus anshuiensis]|uniref:Syndecan n=1 Tax=Sinocyclocheilus anshuiensis TaxID=1608454 RepID=A0A671RU93_9TELE|nr:PREDICTED: syndecan-2-like isoform X2 [Sinocyclocheilus anshuiensis]
MRNVWMILTLGLTAFLSGERIAVSAAKSTSSTDDLYLEEAGSGGYPEDDDDFTSGSGSGTGEVIEETVTVKTLFIVPKAEPTQDSTKDFTPKVETSTSRDVPEDTKKRVRIEDPVPTTEDSRRNPVTSTTSLPRSPLEVQSENLFQRTEVLAAVIAGGVIGFLFAIFLILLLVYRMRKKDEGSYDLGERKPSGAAYQKAPTKEFYA